MNLVGLVSWFWELVGGELVVNSGGYVVDMW
nr:MAG TPA: hypothetical protein [Caudoviricetes sp.]